MGMPGSRYTRFGGFTVLISAANAVQRDQQRNVAAIEIEKVS